MAMASSAESGITGERMPPLRVVPQFVLPVPLQLQGFSSGQQWMPSHGITNEKGRLPDICAVKRKLSER